LVTGGAGFIGSHVAECLLPVVTMSIIDEVNDYKQCGYQETI
jgi:nucleoside-diphosphate-sugar epimerase